MKKYIFVCLFAVLFFAVCCFYCYRIGYKQAEAKSKIKQNEIIATQQKAINDAQQKILDFQRIISYNNDDCFNRVWDEEIIRATNPFLR